MQIGPITTHKTIDWIIFIRSLWGITFFDVGEAFL